MKSRLSPVCDVPGCDAHRKRSQRLCDRCYHRLPGDIRVGLIEAHHQRRMADWRKLRRRAGEFLNLHPAAPVSPPAIVQRVPVSPQRAFELQARLLGERP